MEILAAAMGLTVALERRRGQQGHPFQQAAAAQTGTLIARHIDAFAGKDVPAAEVAARADQSQTKDCPQRTATRSAFPKPFDASAAAAADSANRAADEATPALSRATKAERGIGRS